MINTEDLDQLMITDRLEHVLAEQEEKQKEAKIERINQKNRDVIVQEINKLDVVNYDTVSQLLPKLIQQGQLTLDHSIYTPFDVTSLNSSGVGRYLVYEHLDKDNPLSIWAFAFAPRQKTSIHDHEYKGTVIVLNGPISEKYYTPNEETGTALLHERADRHRFHSNSDNLANNLAHQLKRRKDLGEGISVTLHIYNMNAHKVTPEGETVISRNLHRLYTKEKTSVKNKRPGYLQKYPEATLKNRPFMKPISAICTQVYSVDHPSQEAQHFVTFDLTFAENDQKGHLIIKTDSNHRTAIESKLYFHGKSSAAQFVPWQEDSWQNALMKAWLRYISVAGYCAALTKDLVYELQEREDNSFCYELTEYSKKVARSMYPHGTMVNADGSESHITMVPENHSTWFEQLDEPMPSPKTNDIDYFDILFTYIDFRLTSGLIIALGVVVLTVAFTALNAPSLGVAGIVVGGLGLVSIASGLGFFKAGYERASKEPEPGLSHSSICSV